jgi:hypothetical protein
MDSRSTNGLGIWNEWGREIDRNLHLETGRDHFEDKDIDERMMMMITITSGITM